LISKKDIDCALDFHFTNFPHLVIINRIIERANITKVICVPLFSISFENDLIIAYERKIGEQNSVIVWQKVQF
jgi:hypothetical protein